MSEKKKKDQAVPVVDKSTWPQSQLLLDCTKDKYLLVALATRWAYEIRQRDQSGEPIQVLIHKALREILIGEVKMEDIEKLPPMVKAEKKAAEPITRAILEDMPSGKDMKKDEKDEKGDE